MKFILLLKVILITVSIITGEEERWSGCWTSSSDSSICVNEFGAAFELVRSEVCGSPTKGKRALCAKKYPGCEATQCYPQAIPRSELCKRSFGNRLPVTKGGWEDCSKPGFRSKCCPK